MKRIFLFVITAVLVLLTACNQGKVGSSKYPNLYKDIKNPEVLSEGISWPEGQAFPSFAKVSDNVDAYIIANVRTDVQTMMVSLQGLVNRKKPRLILFGAGYKAEAWPEAMGFSYTITKDYVSLIDKYKGEINGLIVYDNKMRDTVNLATAMAGVENCLVVSQNLADKLTAAPFNFSIKYNFTDQFKSKYEVYDYMYNNVWPKLTHKLIIGLNPATNGHTAQLRDLAIAAKAAVIWLDPKNIDDIKYIAKFFRDTTPAETYYAGWWTSEGDGVGLSAQYGIPTVAADFFENYTVYAGTSRELDIPAVPKKPELQNKFYIAFAISDGDNIQYCEHFMKTDNKSWSSKDRGSVPIGWTSSPLLLDAAPQMLNYFYKTATENDFLISGPSGAGYTYPELWSNPVHAGKDALTKFAQRTDSYFRRTAFNFITIWNKPGVDETDIFAKNIPSMVGFSVQASPNGKEYTVANKLTPLFTAHPQYDGDVPRVQQIIDTQISLWDGTKPGFMLPQVIAWDVSVSDIKAMAAYLKEKYRDKIEFVRVDHLSMLYSEYNNLPYNVALRANVTASGSDSGFSPANIADGSFSKKNGWQSTGKGDKWVSTDLGANYDITRYTIKNAGSGYYPSGDNTKSFKVQASKDGRSWTDIDNVTSNSSNIVDKYVDKFTARYVRVMITDPGADGVARIQEFEIYGNKSGAA